MPYREPAFTIGIEEEYLLVDRASRDLVREPPPELLAECEALLQNQVMPEFLRSQIEVGTRVCTARLPTLTGPLDWPDRYGRLAAATWAIMPP